MGSPLGGLRPCTPYNCQCILGLISYSVEFSGHLNVSDDTADCSGVGVGGVVVGSVGVGVGVDVAVAVAWCLVFFVLAILCEYLQLTTHSSTQRVGQWMFYVCSKSGLCPDLDVVVCYAYVPYISHYSCNLVFICRSGLFHWVIGTVPLKWPWGICGQVTPSGAPFTNMV